ncbi:MAG: hypothetical protein R6V40_02335 [Candidatus Moraniibacteriota bacterium]
MENWNWNPTEVDFVVDFYFKLEDSRVIVCRKFFYKMGLEEKEFIFDAVKFLSWFWGRYIFAKIIRNSTPILVISPRMEFEKTFGSRKSILRNPNKINRNWRDGL